MKSLGVAKQDAESVPQGILYLLEKWGLQISEGRDAKESAA